jgi:putative transposase
MIDKSHDLSVVKQCQILNLSRSSVYYRPRPVSPENLALMRRMDELHLDYPFYGSRGLKKYLRREGYRIGRARVARLMKGYVHSIYRKPNTSKRHPKHPVYPHLLRHMVIERS